MKKSFLSSLSILLIGSFFSCKQEQATAPVAEASAPAEAPAEVSHAEAAKPVQHLKLAKLKSKDEAVKVFNETTAQIKSKSKLDATELHEIHMITYSLEKAITYFADNFTGEQQEVAKKLAVIIEEVHLASESNKSDECKKHLDEYFALATPFASNLN